MGAMFFGQYLLSRGVIGREALIDAIERQRRANLSLTQLAVREGWLSAAQEESILTRYRTSDAALEELCLQSGHLDRRQLDELLEIQRSDWVRIGGALVAGGHLTREQVEEQLARFNEFQRDAEQRLEADFIACPSPETVRTVVELAAFHLGRLTGRPVKLRSLSANGAGLTPGWRRYGQKLVGDRELFVVLDLPAGLGPVVAEGLIGLPLAEGSEAAVDAVCECVNIIGGNACTRLEAEGCRLRPQPPFSTTADEPLAPGRAVVSAEVLLGDGEMVVQVAL